MGKHIVAIIVCIIFMAVNTVAAQTAKVNDSHVADTLVGTKPILKAENISPAGHCDNQEFSFFAPWADHFEIAKRRSDTSWINDYKPANGWTYQSLKPGVTGIIFKRLDEKGTYQFMVKGIKGNKYRESDTLTLLPCSTSAAEK